MSELDASSTVAETQEEISARHKKEKKDLQNQITGLKKQCGSNKSKRKQVNSKCIDLEENLKLKHETEMKEWKKLNGSANEEDEDEDEFSPEKLLQELELKQRKEEEEQSQKQQPEKSVDSQNQNQAVESTEQPKKRRNRQKEKLAKRAAEIARIKEEAEKEAMEQPDLKKMEQDTLDKIFEMNNVRAYDIQPDGHCLFASILDQLKARHSQVDSKTSYTLPVASASKLTETPVQEWTVSDLRSLAANHVREHKDNFIPYLFDEATMSLLDIDEYTTEIETTAKWGGDVELIALANVLNCCISIIFSGRSTLKINDLENQEAQKDSTTTIINPELKLVYYKHTYALGEHYNSLRDA